jgi:hypothetical protein
VPYPQAGHEDLKAGKPRNFQVFKPFDFLAAMKMNDQNQLLL